MNDKQLLTFVLSNIDVFKNELRLIKKNEFDWQQNEPDNGRLIFIYDRKGVKVHHPDSRMPKDYFTFYVYDEGSIEAMIKSGFTINCMGGKLNRFFCHISFAQKLLSEYCTEIFDLILPPYSVSSSFLPYYIQMIEKHLSFGSSVNIKGVGYSSGFSIYCLNKKEGLKNFGAFAYRFMYEHLHWDFTSVELYKDRINWKGLIEYSDLKWTEADIRHYYNYIPFNLGGENYKDMFNVNLTICDFSNICALSNDFLIENIAEINIEAYLKTAELHWNRQDFITFYKIFEGIDKKHNISIRGVSSIDTFYECLECNKKFQWTSQLIAAYWEISNDLSKFLKSKECYRKTLVPAFKEFFLLYQNVIELLDCKSFLCKLIEGNRDFNTYSLNFTIKNLYALKKEWDKIIYHRYDHSHRLSSDTTLLVYSVRTMWNYFNWNNNVELSYELCKTLENMNIVIGGEYEKEYDSQDYIDFGFITKEVNALEFFAKHSIIECDIPKILNDSNLTLKLLKFGNESISKGLFKRLFSDNYAPSEFFALLDNLKIQL